jgi:hypothetical protein
VRHGWLRRRIATCAGRPMAAAVIFKLAVHYSRQARLACRRLLDGSDRPSGALLPLPRSGRPQECVGRGTLREIVAPLHGRDHGTPLSNGHSSCICGIALRHSEGGSQRRLDAYCAQRIPRLLDMKISPESREERQSSRIYSQHSTRSGKSACSSCSGSTPSPDQTIGPLEHGSQTAVFERCALCILS